MATIPRKPPTKYSGVVSRKSTDKTVRVVMNYFTRHPKYGKTLRRSIVAYVHDPENEAREGDVVEICKCRPISKTKSWRLLRVIEKT